MQRATAAGAKVVQPMKDQFYGDRTGSLRDPFGHVWHLATHKEDVSMAEMKKRAEQAAKGAGETSATASLSRVGRSSRSK